MLILSSNNIRQLNEFFFLVTPFTYYSNPRKRLLLQEFISETDKLKNKIKMSMLEMNHYKVAFFFLTHLNSREVDIENKVSLICKIYFHVFDSTYLILIIKKSL